MRMIDAEPLYDKLEDYYKSSCGKAHEMARNCLDAVCDMPTVDAAPVVHGRWTEQHVDYASDCAIDEIQELKCSVCGLYHTTPYVYNITHYKFCPSCGAKMDLEDEQ